MVKYISPVNILFVSKSSSRRLQDMSSRRLEEVFSVTFFCLPRSFQDVLRDVFRTSSRRPRDVFARRLQDVLEDEKLLRWGRVEDVFKTCLEDVFKTNKFLLGFLACNTEQVYAAILESSKLNKLFSKPLNCRIFEISEVSLTWFL